MHYFQFEIKEWIFNTAHLSLEEESAYLRLIFYYYDSEKPILTKDVEKVFRKCRIPEQLGCFILAEFFTSDGDTWIHKRCDEEIERFKSKSQSAKNSAKRRWENKSDANAIQTHTEGNTNHKPLTINHKPLINIKPIYENIDDVSPVDCPHDEIVKMYHKILPELRQVEVWNDTRKSYLKQRWREILKQHTLTTKQEGIDYFNEFFIFIRQSQFLMGKVDRKDGKPFQADLEWMLKPSNFTKIIERKYHK